MPKVNNIICIQCPLGCKIRVLINGEGEIINSKDYQCKLGKKYAEQECKSPERILTTTLRTIQSSRPVLPVRTDKPIPKERVKDCVKLLTGIKARPPLNIADIIVSNILDTGANIITSDDLIS